MNYVQSLIKRICDKHGIEYNLVSQDWVTILKHNKKIRYILGYKFDLNNRATAGICDDKYALYDTLKFFDIPVTEHFIIHKDYNKKAVLDYFKTHDNNLVVKSNTGTCGNDMYHVTDTNDLIKYIDKVLNGNYSISICPYYHIKTEYRTIILNNKVELFYGKKKPVVIGNGKNSIYELLLDFNKIYFSQINPTSELKRILDTNEIYEYNWQFNLSKGAIPFLIKEDNIYNKVTNIALEVAQKLNLKFASIDIIELEDGTLLVLEANSGIMIDNFAKLIKDGEKIAFDLYEKAILEMFK